MHYILFLEHLHLLEILVRFCEELLKLFSLHFLQQQL